MSSDTDNNQKTAVTQDGQEWVKGLGLTSATTLVMGSMIGSGIFIVSADISRTVNSPLWLMLAWVAAGVITLLGALSYDLASRISRGL